MNQTDTARLPSNGASSPPPQRTNISLKLPVMVIGLFLFSFTIFTIISIRVTQGSTVEALREDLTNETEAQANTIRASLAEAKAFATNLAAAAESAEYDQQELLRLIENTLQGNENIFGAAIAYEPFQFDPAQRYWSPYFSQTPDNEMRFTQLGGPDYDYFEQEWYRLPKETNLPALSKPYLETTAGDIWMVRWSVPFHDESGNFMGVAAADIEFSRIQAVIEQIRIGNAGYAFLLDSNGLILAIGERGGNYQALADAIPSLPTGGASENWAALISEMKAGRSGFIEVSDARGTPLYVAFTPIGADTDWSLALGYPREEIFERTNELQTALVLYTILLAMIFGAAVYYFTRSITNPLRQLTDTASRIAAEDPERIKDQLTNPLQIQTQDEIEDLAQAFNQMSLRLKESLETLEEKVAARTTELERITVDLKTIADIAREITVIRDPDTLLNVSASLIRERLHFHHVGIFLVDDKGEFAILRAASGRAAERMLAANYKLKVGEAGLVGRVTRTGQAHTAHDAALEEFRIEDPYLPETRSQIVLPLRSRNVTFGALDIKVESPRAFDQQDMQSLQILADQLAAAIENAQLVRRVEDALTELSKTNRAAARETWSAILSERTPPTYEYDGLQIRAVPRDLPADLLRRLEGGRPIVVQQGRSVHTLLVPLMVLNQIVGVLGLEQEDPDQTWSEEEIAIAQAAANRAALTLENARLLEESQRRASKERTIFESTTRIGSALSIENILQTTAEELEKILHGSEVVIQFTGRDHNGRND